MYRQIVVGTVDGFIMRYDYISDETLKEWEEWRVLNDEYF
jgi:hypothetical protein